VHVRVDGTRKQVLPSGIKNTIRAGNFEIWRYDRNGIPPDADVRLQDPPSRHNPPVPDDKIKGFCHAIHPSNGS
jgi:hypothetical protein